MGHVYPGKASKGQTQKMQQAVLQVTKLGLNKRHFYPLFVTGEMVNCICHSI